MRINKKHLSLVLALGLVLVGLQACNNNTGEENPNEPQENMTMSEESEDEMNPSSIEGLSQETSIEKEYDQMTKDEKISYLEDKIFDIRVKARSLEMKLEENPQYTEEQRKDIQDKLDDTEVLIEDLNKEIDKLENN